MGLEASGTAGVRVERKVSARPGAEGAVVESVRWVVRFVVVVGWAEGGAMRRDLRGD